MKKLILVGHFIASALLTFLLASIAHSQFVLLSLLDTGISITTQQWFTMMGNDLRGLLPGYAPILALSLLLGFILINLIAKHLIRLPEWRYLIAGFIAVATALTAINSIFDIALIASSRSWSGFLSQCIAGLCGGGMFYILRKKEKQNS